MLPKIKKKRKRTKKSNQKNSLPHSPYKINRVYGKKALKTKLKPKRTTTNLGELNFSSPAPLRPYRNLHKFNNTHKNVSKRKKNFHKLNKIIGSKSRNPTRKNTDSDRIELTNTNTETSYKEGLLGSLGKFNEK